MEIADVLVINKSDLISDVVAPVPGGRDKAKAAGTAATTPTKWERPTLHTSAKTGDGITILCGMAEAHHAYLVSSGELARRRECAARAEVIRLLQSRLTASILRALEAPQAQTILAEVAKRKLDPNDAVQKLSGAIGK
jgi:LAO/AO transport system kinase